MNSDNLYRVRYDNYRGGELEFSCAAAVPAVIVFAMAAIAYQSIRTSLQNPAESLRYE